MQNQKAKTVWLVRHSHVQMPGEQKCYLGRTDIALSEKGIAQAEWLREFFADKAAAAVYHSPLHRCVQTAKILADKHAECIAVSDLQEIHMGSWEMLPIEKLKSEQPEVYRLRGEQMDTFRPPGGESFAECQERIVAAFQNIASQQKPGSSVIIVAHAGVNRCLLSWILKTPLKDLLAIPQPHACITKLTETDGVWQIADAIECPVK